MQIELKNGFSITEIRESDQARLVELLKERQIYEQTLNIPFPYTASDATKWIQHLKNEVQHWGKNFSWAIRDPQGDLAGGIGFHGFELVQPQRAEIGYWLGRPYWNQGIMTDAIGKIIRHGFQEFGFTRLTAHVFDFNPASVKALERSGFVYEGRLRRNYEKDGKVFDGLVYGIIPEDLERHQASLKKQRPPFIRNFKDLQEGLNSSFYSGSEEFHSVGSAFSKAFDMRAIGLHHEILPVGRRTSWPHAESEEEEFVFVIEGTPDVWIDGELYPLFPGDAVGFPSGTGITHTFMNNSRSDVRLLVGGEKSKKTNQIYYPLHPVRRKSREDWWHDVPKKNLGPHDGLPDQVRAGPAPLG